MWNYPIFLNFFSLLPRRICQRVRLSIILKTFILWNSGIEKIANCKWQTYQSTYVLSKTVSRKSVWVVVCMCAYAMLLCIPIAFTCCCCFVFLQRGNSDCIKHSGNVFYWLCILLHGYGNEWILSFFFFFNWLPGRRYTKIYVFIIFTFTMDRHIEMTNDTTAHCCEGYINASISTRTMSTDCLCKW